MEKQSLSKNIDESCSNNFSLIVDSHDHKAKEFNPFSLSSPHMRAFHLAWLSLFSCFFSTFSIPPLLEVIRKDLNLTDIDVGRAGIASFIGSIVSRLAMGPACDIFGPRAASATLSLFTVPIVLSTALISGPQGFILVRFLIGFCLANFVASQFWMSSMFSGCVVGLANGFAAGWANVGSGLTQLVMPLQYSLFTSYLNIPPPVSWRMAFIFPAIFQAVTAILVLLYGQDLPDGGIISDKMGNRFGMRGRLWSLWVVQSVAGLLCVVLGQTNTLGVSVLVMACFSMFVQAASGLTFGIVPFVSKRSLGVISGMTGSGGTLGAVITQVLLFSGSTKFSTQTSISIMGLMMLVFTLPITFIYFPKWGGIFCGPSSEEDDENYHLLE